MAEKTELAPIQTLSTSLNYTKDTITSIFDKKQKQQLVSDLITELDTITETAENADDLLTENSLAEAIEQTKSSFTAAMDKARVVQSDVAKNLASPTIKALKKLNKEAGKTEAKINLAVEADDDERPPLEEEARESLQKLLNQCSALEVNHSQLTNALSVRKDLSLDDKELSADYFLSCMATALYNDILPDEDPDNTAIANIRERVSDLSQAIEEKLQKDLNAILHDENFRELEQNWMGLNDLLEHTDWSANVMVDVLDCTKEELEDDFKNNSVDLMQGEFFKKLYIAEYDQYGGFPYSSVIGLYEFDNSISDRRWLKTMSKVAAASHAPFISSVGPKFFGCETIQELSDIKDLDAHMNHPRFQQWQEFREAEEAAYIGLTFPKYLLRAPYHSINNPTELDFAFDEKISDDQGHEDFLWGNAAVLFGRNMLRSFAQTGWAQYLRGPKAGGLINHLPRHVFNLNGQEELKAPVEMIIPDYRELRLANNGFMPLVYRKGTADACFFSCQSIKKPKKFKDPQDTENSQLVTNISYTFSITRIAHYIKCIMRDNIGTSADEEYINKTIQSWLDKFVTTVIDPDNITLKHYPFKAAITETKARPGMIGWYNCNVKILPHIQFEGMDATLEMDVRI
jgi:type VI secretion system protein ImpC